MRTSQRPSLRELYEHALEFVTSRQCPRRCGGSTVRQFTLTPMLYLNECDICGLTFY